MRLHEDPEAFLYAIGQAQELFGLRASFLEKDYWVTLLLKRLADSAYAGNVVFKGGTSLSKCYSLIDRFSEDIDLAIDNPYMGDSARKKLMKSVERELVWDLDPVPDPEESLHKGGRKRTTFYNYPKIASANPDGGITDRLKLEITAFSSTFPNQQMPAESYLGKALAASDQKDILEAFHLPVFQVRVLGLERTLCEKVMALVKRGFSDNPMESLREKVRHIYDLQQMISRSEDTSDFLESDLFFEMLSAVIEDDKINSTSDLSWVGRRFGECCLFNEAAETWEHIEPSFEQEFRQLLFGDLPTSNQILACLQRIGDRLRKFDRIRVR
jgi:predicted nucleotidyltransferase component of viral defense system